MKTSNPESHTLTIQSLPYQNDAEHYFKKISSLDKSVFLDSGKPECETGRYDILSALPDEYFTNISHQCLEDTVIQMTKADELTSLALHDLPFTGGAIGFWAYESQHKDFDLEHDNDKLLNAFGLYSWALIQDHKKQKTTLFFLSSCSHTKKQAVMQCLSQTQAETSLLKYTDQFQCSDLKADISREYYNQAIANIKHHLRVGDTYQVNFTQRFSGQFSGAAAAAYQHLRRRLPGSYSAYLDFPQQKTLSFSPERFLHIANRECITQPIKGTIARGKTPSEDKTNAESLISSPKNQAENLMIVDLLRNDLSKVCNPHSVQTCNLFELVALKNVFHLVSTVKGKLKENISPLAAFSACFPGGSITGAPKKRAMEIIQSLERHARGVYCGSVAYISTNGQLDSNIAIRTIAIRDGHCFCWGGGGIVYDSLTEDEYEESIQKVLTLLQGLDPSFSHNAGEQDESNQKRK